MVDFSWHLLCLPVLTLTLFAAGCSSDTASDERSSVRFKIVSRRQCQRAIAANNPGSLVDTCMARITRFAHGSFTTYTIATKKRNSTTRKPTGISGRISPMTRGSRSRKRISKNGCRKPTPSTSGPTPPQGTAKLARSDRGRNPNRPPKHPFGPPQVLLADPRFVLTLTLQLSRYVDINKEPSR